MSNLEEKVESKESKGFIAKAGKLLWKTGMAAATTALSVATVGSLGIWVGSAFALGGTIANLAKGKSLYDSFSEGLTTYSAVNIVIYPMVLLGDLTFPLIPNYNFIGQAARAVYAATIYNAAFVSTFRGAGHLVDNYMNPKGITKTIGDGFAQKWFEVGATFSPFYALAANGYTGINFGSLTIPTFAVGALPVGFVLDYFLGKKKQPNGYAPAHAGAH